MDKEAVLNDGHYILKLPFRKADVCMSDNRQIAEQRLQSLKREMNKDEQNKHFLVTSLRVVMQRRPHRKNSDSQREKYGTCHTMGCTTLKRKSLELSLIVHPSTLNCCRDLT